MKDFKVFCIGFLVFSLSTLVVHAGQYRTDEVIVKFKTRHVQSLSAIAISEERPMAVAVDDVEKAISEMKALEDIEYVEPNYVIEAELVPDDWPYIDKWGQLGLDSAWDLIAQNGPGQEVVIAIIDSGVDMNHPDLKGKIIPGYDFANHDGTPEDDSGHGTKVCGILGAIGDNDKGIAGVAWDVNIGLMPLKFMKQDADGKTTGSVSDAVDAIYYAADHGARIINASWGFYSYSRALQDAIKYAEGKGVLFVASAGNNGQDNDVKDHYPSNYQIDNVIAVAAMDSGGSLASFSNYGTKNVHIIAPGVGISTTTIGGAYVSLVSGTSFATPFVTAIAAMVLSQVPELDYGSLKTIILTTATKTPSSGSSLVASGGCVNAHEALVAGESFTTSATSLPAQGTTDAASNAGSSPSASGEGGGGGCFIKTAQSAVNPIYAALFMIMIVLFQVPRKKGLE